MEITFVVFLTCVSPSGDFMIQTPIVCIDIASYFFTNEKRVVVADMEVSLPF